MKRKTRLTTSDRITVEKTAALGGAAAVAVLMVLRSGVVQASVFALALAVHEGFHLLCASLLGVRVSSVRPSLLGMSIRADFSGLTGMKAALLFMSGPAANLLFAACAFAVSLFTYVPNVAFLVFYNCLTALVNCVPAYPMDAARALEGVIAGHSGRLAAVRTMAYCSWLCGLVIFCLGLYIFLVRTDNLVLMVMGILIFLSARRELASAETGALKEKAADALARSGGN